MASDRSVLRHVDAVLPDRIAENVRIEIEHGRIAAVVPENDAKAMHGDDFELTGFYVMPGFVDIHVHGGAGADFMDGSVAAVREAASAHLLHGTTTLFPTTTTGSPNEILAMIESCRTVATEGGACSSSLPHIPGVHLYGPFFAADKCGCHAPEGRRDPSVQEFGTYFGTGFVRVATCAAELPAAVPFYETAREYGCLATCGHSNASWREMQAAFEAGMRHVDHFWCAMSTVPSIRARLGSPMQGSMEQFVLMNREMSTEVIADGEHLSNELLEFAYRMIGPERLCLVTDSSRALDCLPGKYKFGHCRTGSDFESDGRVGLAPGGGLASSVQGMDHMVRTMAAATSAPLWDVVRMATSTPARLTGLDHDRGRIAVGLRADLLVTDKSLDIRGVMKDGKFVAWCGEEIGRS